jgi:hypothetical protein
VDYLAWKRMPFREPNDRIAKYGQGFSKMLKNLHATADESMGMSQAPSAGMIHSQSKIDNYNFKTQYNSPLHTKSVHVTEKKKKQNNRNRSTSVDKVV